MKLSILSLLLLGVVAYSDAALLMNKPFYGAGPSGVPNVPEIYHGIPIHKRERRQDRGSVVITGTKPMSGPDRKPSLDIDYNHRIIGDDRGHVNAYGGANMRPGQINPHAGINFERNYKNGYVGGFGQVQNGPRGRPDPSFGIRGGVRF